MRSCDRCGTRMPPFVARRTVGPQRVCQSCAGLKNLAALENPIADKQRGKHPEEWYHGSPHGFDEFDDPGEGSSLSYEEVHPGEDSSHWNTLLGNHFTSDHRVARAFSGGEHTLSENYGDEPLSHVIHVKLHLKNPKVYKSEHDMDQEAHEFEHARGNTYHQWYSENPDEDPRKWAEDDEGFDPDFDDDHGEARLFRDDEKPFSKGDPDPRFPYTFHPKATGWLNNHPDKHGIAMRFRDRLKDQGYDGIVYGNEYEGSDHGKQASSAIAFEPYQIEITQHHYGNRGCLSPQEAAERKPPPRGQMTLPGLEHPERKLPKERRPDVTKEWPETWTPAYFERPRRYVEPPPGASGWHPELPVHGSKRAEDYDTGRLWAPLPQECWDRYYGRHSAAQRRTAAMGDPTDWDAHYDPGMQVHRGMVIKVPYGLYDKLHDPGSVAEAAQALADRTAKRASTGMHWSADLEQARDFPTRNVAQGSALPVILHAQVPAREGIETRPGVLKRNEVFPHDHREREVPLRKGTGVDVFGISWKPDQPHPAADEHGWVRHDFTAPVRHTAKSWTMKYTTYGPNGGYVDKEREVEGPLYHGSRSKRLREDDLIVPGRKTNPWGDEGAKSKHVFFTENLATAQSYADDAGGHVYEVEPTGEFHTDYNGEDYRTQHPLRVVRKVTGGKTAALGEESARQHAGQQDVYAVRSGNTMVNLCGYHRDVHVSNAKAADALGDQLGIGSRERSAESLGEARKGSCAACNRDTDYQLKLLTPRWMQNASDSRARRRPDKPMRTKPLPTLKQSENIRRGSKGDLFHADSGAVRFHPEGTPRHIGDHTIPAGAEVHTDENEAWNKAIEHWKNGRTDFPRVYVAHGSAEHGKLTHEAEASELDYDHERHPAIRSDNEEPHEPIMYHGSTRDEYDDPPEEITPSGGGASFGPGVADPSYAYATPSLNDAWNYAHKRSENGIGGKPTVYRVTPHKPEDVEEDPHWEGDYNRGNYDHDKRSKSGFEVLDEVPMSQSQEDEWRHSPFNDEAENDWDDDEGHYASLKTLADWEDDEDEYDPDECEHCGEDKNSDDHAEVHHDWIHDQKWHTDWDEDREVGAHNNGEIQRGMAISLPKDVHRIVHDEDRPLEERGRALAEHVIKSANDQGHIGRFWTDEDSVARQYATGSRVQTGSKDDNKTPATPVTLHVKFPGYHHIETDPDELEHHGVYSYHIENNREVPLQHGTPLEAVGVSWAHHKYGDDGLRHWDSDNADWKRHTFKEPIKAMSSKQPLPTLRMIAHDATENEAIRHCPFCGGGKIIGRADGTVECEFCHHYFTVQVQPQYPNFPQTVNGMPQDIPGMPGQVEQPSVDGGGGGFPPGDDEDAGDDAPPWAQDGGQDYPDDAAAAKEGDQAPPGDTDDDDDQPPPFAKKSSVFRTATGALLWEDDYVRHLAIRLAPDRAAMIARIREERGA